MWETDYGLATSVELRTESNVADRGSSSMRRWTVLWWDKVRMTELIVGLDYRPGQSYVNSKQHEWL